MEDIQPAKSRPAAAKKAPSIQKSIQELTQDFKDLLSEKVCVWHCVTFQGARFHNCKCDVW